MAYAHDAAGNRTSETRNGQVTTSTYDDAGQLVSVGAKTYTYDADGNLLQAGSDSFAWDHEDRLTQATVGSHTASYTYDGDGVRVGATVDGVASSYLVDAQGGLPTLVEDGTKAYLHADGVLGEMGGGTRYALGDALGSVRGLTDESGSLVGTASYEAFGAPRASSGASSLFGFTGEPTDATGLVYMRARTLDPATGRFLSADTVIPNAPGTSGYNLYAYAGNDPTTWTDPTGHQVLTPEQVRSISEQIFKGLGPAFALEYLAFVLLSQPITIFTVLAFLVVAVVLALLLLWVLGLLGNGSGSDEGTPGPGPEELEEAQNSPQVPPPPVPPGPPPGGTCADGNDDVTPPAVNQHHSTPIFMGGDVNQPLTTMLRSEHVELHNEMNRFLETKTDGEGHTMRYSCINKGDDIRENFTLDERLQALAEFYRGPGARFTRAAADFFAQHPEYR